MTLDEILAAQPTLSTTQSVAAVLQLLNRPWRCYSSRYISWADDLISRFIRAHAVVPGIITDTMLSFLPAQVFFYTTRTAEFRGGLWLNGAVLWVRDVDIEEPTRSLFIDDETAQKWGYPDDYLRAGASDT